MKAITRIAALLLAASLSHAHAQQVEEHIPVSPVCVSAADATKQVAAFMKANPKAELETVVDAPSVTTFMESFNTLPPVSDYVADEYWVLANPVDDGPIVRIFFFVKGETCVSSILPLDKYMMVVKHAEGLLPPTS